MNKLFFILLFTFSAFASERHIVMVSDSRGNCAFAHKMMRNFYTLPDTTFRMVSAGGSAPCHWMDAKKRFVSPYGLDKKGDSNSIPVKFPKALALTKTKTPFFPELLKDEFKGKTKLLTIVNLGTNAQNTKTLKDDALSMIQEIHKSGSSCVWVGPPHTQGFPLKLIQAQTKAITDAIKEAGPNAQGEHCKLINSLEITNYPFTTKSKGIDGIHYCWNPQLIELGYEWADRAFDIIKESL